MTKIKLILDKDACINCGACVPESWDNKIDRGMIEQNDKEEAHIVGVPEKAAGEGAEELEMEIDDETLKKLKNAALVCPVDCIHIEYIKSE